MQILRYILLPATPTNEISSPGNPVTPKHSLTLTTVCGLCATRSSQVRFAFDQLPNHIINKIYIIYLLILSCLAKISGYTVVGWLVGLYGDFSALGKNDFVHIIEVIRLYQS